ncbi:MAG: CheR family methyltransferase [Thiotrichales bacterium]
MGAKQFLLTDEEFRYFKELAKKVSGISLADNKKELVYGRVSRRLRTLSLNSFKEYIQILEKRDPAELEQFSNMITTNLTSFFRESHHFDFLKSNVMPSLMKARSSTKKISIWSAGCSTGEEPYSIAMALLDGVPNIKSWNIKIYATDIDSKVVQHARNGVYELDKVSGLPGTYMERFFMKGVGQNKGFARVKKEVSDLIEFSQLNLMNTWPFDTQLDIIFCRNVVIYFDQETQTRLFSRFSDALADDGRFFAGHSEALYKVTDKFDLLGKTVYQKVA